MNPGDNRPSGIKSRSINSKNLQLHLDEIENISDCDIDSIKNTSARAITFNQFELTKNMINSNNSHIIDDSLVEGVKGHEKLN